MFLEKNNRRGRKNFNVKRLDSGAFVIAMQHGALQFRACPESYPW